MKSRSFRAAKKIIAAINKEQHESWSKSSTVFYVFWIAVFMFSELNLR